MIKGKLINGDARLMVFFAGAEDKKKNNKNNIYTLGILFPSNHNIHKSS